MLGPADLITVASGYRLLFALAGLCVLLPLTLTTVVAAGRTVRPYGRDDASAVGGALKRRALEKASVPQNGQEPHRRPSQACSRTTSGSHLLESFVKQTTERLRVAALLGHGGEVGRAREQALRDLLGSFLPPAERLLHVIKPNVSAVR